MGGIRKCKSPGQNVTSATPTRIRAGIPGSREMRQRGGQRAEIRISCSNCRAFRLRTREISKGKRGGRPGMIAALAPRLVRCGWSAAGLNGDALTRLKKKPEIVRSRAKSTKGGGWRRQPWHVGSGFHSLRCRGSFCLGLAFEPRRLRFNIR